MLSEFLQAVEVERGRDGGAIVMPSYFRSGAAPHVEAWALHHDGAEIRLKIDGRKLSQAVLRHTLQRASRGPSSLLVGGSLVEGG